MTSDFAPDFVGVGAMKCGTTWIAKALASHPEIFMPAEKELHFFNQIYAVTYRGKEASRLDREGIEKYREEFAGKSEEKIAGEFSTRYLCDPTALKKIAKIFPKTKILVALRNPINRTWSHLNHERANVFFPYSPKISALEIFYREPDFLQRSKYCWQLDELFRYFSREQIFVIVIEDFWKNPAENFFKLFRFLGVRNDFLPPTLNQKTNSAVRDRVPLGKIITRAGQALRTHRMKALINFFYSVGGQRILEQLYDINRRPMTPEEKKIPDEVRDFLQKEFRDDVKNLRKILKKPDLWATDF